MPRVLLYEFLTSGGSRGSNGLQTASLRREGLAMLSALAADFAAIEGVTTSVVLDASIEPHRRPWNDCQIIPVDSSGGDCGALAAHCRHADWTVVIAPEFEQILESRLRLVECSGGRLLGPSATLAALAADKQRMAEHLASSKVSVAAGESIAVANLAAVATEIQFPAVGKPIDGCGSLDMWLLQDCDSAKRVAGELLAMHGPAKTVRIERYYPGIAASVAVLCGPEQMIPLRACSQRLSLDGRFRYLGGRCSLDLPLAARAESLAIRAVQSLEAPLGYLGVDLVLGSEPDGRDDLVIEINPRLTTSYVGLRAVARTNLAAAMFAIAEGQPAILSYHERTVEFGSDGTLRTSSANQAIATGPARSVR